MAELVSKMYSEALFELAQEKGMLFEVQEGYAFFERALKDNPQYFELLKTPKLDASVKKELIKEAFADAIPETLLHFFMVVFDKKRGDELLNIKRGFDERVDAHNNVVHAMVESVIPLTSDQSEALVKKLELISGKKVILKAQIKPDLLGGIVVKIGDQIIDGSVKFKLQNMLEGLTQIII